MHPALHDREERLIGPGLCSHTSLCPKVRSGQRLRIGVPVVGLRALIERHDDIGAQILLDLNGLLRRDAVDRAIQVGAKGDATLIHCALIRKREKLKPSRVGQYRLRPGHESMQSPHFRQ